MDRRKAAFIKKPPPLQPLTGQILTLEFLLHAHDALLIAVRGQIEQVAEFGGVFAKVPFALRKQELADGLSLAVGLVIVVAGLPVAGPTIFVEVAVLVAHTLSTQGADVGQFIALPHRPIRRQVNPAQARTVADHPSFRAVLGLEVAPISASRERRQTVALVVLNLMEDVVIDRDALSDGLESMKVVQTVDCTRIPFNAELVPIDPNPNRRRVTALNLEARRRVAQLLAGLPVVVADASVANLRELVREYLLYREVVVEHPALMIGRRKHPYPCMPVTTLHVTYGAIYTAVTRNSATRARITTTPCYR